MKIPKPRRLAKRDPMAAELIRNPLYRTRAEATVDERKQRADPWDRNAKHKTQPEGRT